MGRLELEEKKAVRDGKPAAYGGEEKAEKTSSSLAKSGEENAENEKPGRAQPQGDDGVFSIGNELKNGGKEIVQAILVHVTGKSFLGTLMLVAMIAAVLDARWLGPFVAGYALAMIWIGARDSVAGIVEWWRVRRNARVAPAARPSAVFPAARWQFLGFAVGFSLADYGFLRATPGFAAAPPHMEAVFLMIVLAGFSSFLADFAASGEGSRAP